MAANNNNSASAGQGWPPPPRPYPHQHQHTHQHPSYQPYPPQYANHYAATNVAAAAAAAAAAGVQNPQHMNAYRGMAQPRVTMQQQYNPNMYYPAPHLYPYTAAPDAAAMAAATPAALTGGTQPVRKSPTNSIDSNIRSIDNAIQANHSTGNAAYSSAGVPHYFRTGSTISSYGDFDMRQHIPIPSYQPEQTHESEADRARRAFNEADKDKSGYITFREFLESIADLALKIPYHDALDKFSKLDTDKDGRVVETEFVNGYLKDRLGSNIFR